VYDSDGGEPAAPPHAPGAPAEPQQPDSEPKEGSAAAHAGSQQHPREPEALGGDADGRPLAPSGPPPSRRCCFAVSSDDTVSAAVRISVSAGRPAFTLSFASKNLPGGAVASGVLAQEECVFRQTALSLLLPPEVRPSCYPLPPGRVVVCRRVAVVRGPHPAYEWLSEPYVLIDVATSAAAQKPPLTECGEQYSDGGVEMRMRAASVLRAAVRNGSTHLVLGAWGCGGFRNPARGLAEVFRGLIVDEGFARFFAHVEFAIPGQGKHVKAFSEVFRDLLDEAGAEAL